VAAPGAEQAAEKALKALLRDRGIEFPPVHDLGELVDLLTRKWIAVPERIREAVSLTHYAVQTRYPGDYEPVSEQEWHEALQLATAVVRWVEGELAPTNRADGSR
jgi:HEPN domain-containing protein